MRGKAKHLAVKQIGTSRRGRPLEVYFYPGALSRPLDTLILGGFHGDERAAVSLLKRYLKTGLPGTGKKNSTAVVPLVNPDGYALGIRFNAAGVDLNRNFPGRWSQRADYPSGEKPLSEPESRAIHDFILRYRPRAIISLHWALSELDADGAQSEPLARRMYASLGPGERGWYRVRCTPDSAALGPQNLTGTLGAWAGFALLYPGGSRPSVVTLELPYTYRKKRLDFPLPRGSFGRACRLWNQNPGAYLSRIGPGVLRMLGAA